MTSRKLGLISIILMVLAIDIFEKLTISALLISPSGSSNAYLNTPIAINSFTTKSVITPPMVIRITNLKNGKLINDGSSVMVTSDEFTAAFIFGGVLGNNTYKFSRIVYLWNNDKNGIAATTVDGRGTPLEAFAVFYNINYGSFGNSLNYGDGLAIVCYRTIVAPGPLNNPAFYKFSSYLKQITEAGSEMEIPITSAFMWYDITSVVGQQYYYAYPGQYTDFKTKKHYKCATIIIIPLVLNSFPFISEKQFEGFRMLKTYSGKQLNTAQPRYPQAFRPVVRSAPIKQVSAQTS